MPPSPEWMVRAVTPPPGGEGCIVNLVGLFRMQISADGVGDILGTNFIDIDPIPLQFSGTTVTMNGSQFPEVFPSLGDDPPADMVIDGDIPNNVATGTYDPDTGRIDIPGFRFLVRIYPPGDALGSELGRFDTVPAVTFSTDSGVTASGGNGPTPSISVDGQPYNPADGSVTLALGVTLPTTLGSLSAIDDAVGGGVLVAEFKGVFDQDPANCTDDGGTPPRKFGWPQ